MSNPRRTFDASTEDALHGIETREGRRSEVGGFPIARVLPTKGRRTVGPWCFVDLMNPDEVREPDPMEVGPHPHMGLSTVTWLLDGEALHTDSLGTEQVIRPGQLNLMGAGAGIAHAELGSGEGKFRGAQLWLAQPSTTRHDASWFEHHSSLPEVDVDGTTASVLIGELAGTVSPARQEWDTVGAQLSLQRGVAVEVPVDTTHEHAVVPLDAPVLVAGHVVEVGSLALVAAGTELLPLEARSSGRALLLGGRPLGEDITMWWNFVGRSKEEITEAWTDWQARDEDRFPPVASDLERIPSPTPPWIRV